MLPKKHLGVKCSSSKSFPSTYLRGLVAPLHITALRCWMWERREMGQDSSVSKHRVQGMLSSSELLFNMLSKNITFRFLFQERGPRGYKVAKVSHPPGLRTGMPPERGLQARAGDGAKKTHINQQARRECLVTPLGRGGSKGGTRFSVGFEKRKSYNPDLLRGLGRREADAQRQRTSHGQTLTDFSACRKDAQASAPIQVPYPIAAGETAI